ncbi:MAG TPA: hypothetical protein VEH26_06310 [Chthoniobacterales bacterium]|nr:hypothetical protein [Chthoniobacterales bacterium]
MKPYIGILSALFSLALMVGCASSNPDSGTASAASAADAANRQTMRQQQTNIDAANAAAMQNRGGGAMGH